MLNVYKIPGKEHQVVGPSGPDEMSVSQILFWKYLEYLSLILRKNKKLKTTKIVILTISSFQSAQHILVTNQNNFRKTKKCPLNISFLYKFLCRV